MKETLNANAQAVLDVVRTSPHHPTALEVYELVKEERPRIGLASVYRILHTLVEQGQIKELKHGDESCRYDGHIARHDHAICVECGALLDVPVDICVPEEVLRQAAQASGIELMSHELRIYGRCPACNQGKQREI